MLAKRRLLVASGLLAIVSALSLTACNGGAAAPTTAPVPSPVAPQPSSTPTAGPTATPTPTSTQKAGPTIKPTGTSISTPQPPAIDQLLAHCPTAQEVAAINKDLKLSFEADPTTGKWVCTAAAGSADLTLMQRRAYQTLQAMKQLKFSKPLPWTDKQLYEWFVSTIKAIRFRSDAQFSFCCDPKDTINVRVASNVYIVLTDRWIDPSSGGGLMDSAVLYVHEARHNQGLPHTCGANDKTIAELGAWGVQYYLDTWLADYSDPNFISDPYYRQIAKSDAEQIRKTRFCDEPK